MAEERAERQAPLVEVVVKDPRAGAKASASALKGAFLAGVVGALGFVGVVSPLSAYFLPWYRAPSRTEALAECKGVVEAKLASALDDFMLAQLAAALGGFVLVFAFAFLRSRRKRS